MDSPINPLIKFLSIGPTGIENTAAADVDPQNAEDFKNLLNANLRLGKKVIDGKPLPQLAKTGKQAANNSQTKVIDVENVLLQNVLSPDSIDESDLDILVMGPKASEDEAKLFAKGLGLSKSAMAVLFDNAAIEENQIIAEMAAQKDQNTASILSQRELARQGVQVDNKQIKELNVNLSNKFEDSPVESFVQSSSIAPNTVEMQITNEKLSSTQDVEPQTNNMHASAELQASTEKLQSIKVDVEDPDMLSVASITRSESINVASKDAISITTVRNPSESTILTKADFTNIVNANSEKSIDSFKLAPVDVDTSLMKTTKSASDQSNVVISKSELVDQNITRSQISRVVSENLNQSIEPNNKSESSLLQVLAYRNVATKNIVKTNETASLTARIEGSLDKNSLTSQVSTKALVDLIKDQQKNTTADDKINLTTSADDLLRLRSKSQQLNVDTVKTTKVNDAVSDIVSKNLSANSSGSIVNVLTGVLGQNENSESITASSMTAKTDGALNVDQRMASSILSTTSMSSDKTPLVSNMAEQAAAVKEQFVSRFSTELAQRFTSDVQNGNYKIEFDLLPKELGKVEVFMEYKDGKLDALISSAHNVTRDVLNDGLQRLRDTLINSGINLGNLDVGSGSQRYAQQEAFAQNRFKSSDSENNFATNDENLAHNIVREIMDFSDLNIDLLV